MIPIAVSGVRRRLYLVCSLFSERIFAARGSADVPILLKVVTVPMTRNWVDVKAVGQLWHSSSSMSSKCLENRAAL